MLLVALAACAVGAALFWSWLQGQETDLVILDTAWQGILVLWLLGGAVLAAASVLRYLALRRMTPAEAELYLQDVLWRETRGEQRRLNRWLAWAWLRRRRREEKEEVMSFWIREAAGWLLIVLGLASFGLSIRLPEKSLLDRGGAAVADRHFPVPRRHPSAQGGGRGARLLAGAGPAATGAHGAEAGAAADVPGAARRTRGSRVPSAGHASRVSYGPHPITIRARPTALHSSATSPSPRATTT